MKLSLAVNPNAIDRSSTWDSLLENAKTAGFSEVFTSIHLPEFTIEEQIGLLEKLNAKVKKYQMELCVDLGGPQIREILNDAKRTKRVRDTKIDTLRMDFGFTPEDLKQIIEELKIKGFSLNASMLSEEKLVYRSNLLKSIDANVRLSACHNYYPRPETGLDVPFYLAQNKICHRLGLAVMTCVPLTHDQRGPIYAGLPTLEKHRGKNLKEILVDLLPYLQEDDGILLADENCQPQEFEWVKEIFVERELTLPVVLEADCPKYERDLLLAKRHILRYDANDLVLRSLTSRAMSQYALPITPRVSQKRSRGAVTIDNNDYQRYSGEIQFVRRPLPKDKRVNLIGTLSEASISMMEKTFQHGFHYRFKEEKK